MSEELSTEDDDMFPDGDPVYVPPFDQFLLDARLQKFPLNTSGRDWFVGDIHGCFKKFHEALVEKGFDFSKDRCFSVGDLVDRNDESKNVLNMIAQPWFFPVRGNHEDMLVRTQKGIWKESNYIHNGGEWFFKLDAKARQDIATVLDRMPYAIEVETHKGIVVVAHAALPGKTWEATKRLMGQEDFDCDVGFGPMCSSMRMLWDRDAIRMRNPTEVPDIHAVVFGHTPLVSPLRRANMFYIDTGAVYTGKQPTVVTVDDLCSESSIWFKGE